MAKHSTELENNLLAELREQAIGSAFAILVLESNSSTKFINSKLPDDFARSALNVLLAGGATPLGFIRIIRIEKGQRAPYLAITIHGTSDFYLEPKILKMHQGESAVFAGQILRKVIQLTAQSLEFQFASSPS